MNLSEIDLNLLVSLDAILSTRSVTAAADKVGLSKPATSHALARIRALVGDEILVRSGKQWILTERARAMAAPLAAILAQVEALVAADRPFEPAALEREFRIHTTDHVLVAPRGRAGGAADAALAALGERRRVTRALPYFMAALHCVAESDAIATLSERLARAHAERFGLQVLRPPLELAPYTIEQIWHPRVEDEPAHAWLRRLIAGLAHAVPKL